jgi:hypothetical protein
MRMNGEDNASPSRFRYKKKNTRKRTEKSGWQKKHRDSDPFSSTVACNISLSIRNGARSVVIQPPEGSEIACSCQGAALGLPFVDLSVSDPHFSALWTHNLMAG